MSYEKKISILVLMIRGFSRALLLLHDFCIQNRIPERVFRAHSGMYTTRGYINDKFPPHFLAFLFFLILTLRCYRRSSSLVTVRSCLHSTALQDLIANLPFNSLCWPFPKGPRASFDWFGLVRSGGRVGLSIFDFTLFYGLEFYSVPCLLI